MLMAPSLRGRSLVMLVTLLSSAVAPRGQTPAPEFSARTYLSEFEGVYDYRDGLTVAIAGINDRLFAIIGDAKYPLRPSTRDTFTNGSGDRIPFARDEAGRVIAFTERGDRFRRKSSIVPVEARALLDPWPRLGGKPGPYRYAAPPPLDGVRADTADPARFSPDLATRLVNGVIDGTYSDVHSILVYDKYALRLEEYFYGYDRNRSHQMRSLTKSVVSLLAGIAVDRGMIRANEPILARLGYATYANPDPRKARITLLDLLSNQSGLACDDHDGNSPGHEVKLYESDDWPKVFVDLPMIADPGTVGRYCSGGFFTVGRILERVTGKPLPEFADEVLFAPLGMRRDQWKWNFTLNRSQRNEFGQLYLRPRDMLKLGVLIQQRGAWQNQQIVSAAWIGKATSRLSRVDDSDYGLGIWHRWYNVPTNAGDRRVDTIMLSGNGGQKVYVVPSLELIVVFTGGAFNSESPVNGMMALVLLPALVMAQEDEGRTLGRAAKDPVGALREHVEQIAGKDSLDCAPPSRGFPESESDRARAVELMDGALSCVRTASSRGRASLAFWGTYGVDSWLATGVIGKGDGTMLTFTFDSMPCGGPGCASSFRTRPCTQPTATLGQDGVPRFGCHDPKTPAAQ